MASCFGVEDVLNMLEADSYDDFDGFVDENYDNDDDMNENAENECEDENEQESRGSRLRSASGISRPQVEGSSSGIPDFDTTHGCTEDMRGREPVVVCSGLHI